VDVLAVMEWSCPFISGVEDFEILCLRIISMGKIEEFFFERGYVT